MIDTRPLTTRLLSEASQENCDGIEHDLMMEAYHRITELEARLIERHAEKWKVYDAWREECAKLEARVSELEKENTRWAKVADAQAAEIAALREVNEWISVEDRLPEKNITILIYSPATVYFGWVGDDNRFQTSTVFLDDATLWKPITPPKGIEI
jgi:hypothetical protein